ncbi:uncharacterized protein V6R79_026085 [Siganus canaliculatus]
MNAKLAVALILALQVSLSLCDAPAPSAEVVQKYSELKEKFLQRLRNFYTGTDLEQRVQGLGENPEVRQRLDTLAKVGSATAAELDPVLEKVRLYLLGQYEARIRSQYRQEVEQAIQYVQSYLDLIMPAQ